MRLIWSIACERAPLNRDRNAANLGEHVKRNKETRELRTDRGLSRHRFFQPVSGCMNVVSVEVIEDFEVLGSHRLTHARKRRSLTLNRRNCQCYR